MNGIAIFIFIFASVLRVAGNMYYAGMEERLWAYWYGRNLFEVLAIVSILLLAKGVPRAIISFFLGLSAYSAIKELTCPTCLDWNEYIGVAIGGFLFIAQIIRHVRDKRKSDRYNSYK